MVHEDTSVYVSAAIMGGGGSGRQQAYRASRMNFLEAWQDIST